MQDDAPFGRFYWLRVCANHASADSELNVHQVTELPETIAAEKALIKAAKEERRTVNYSGLLPGSDDW